MKGVQAVQAKPVPIEESAFIRPLMTSRPFFKAGIFTPKNSKITRLDLSQDLHKSWCSVSLSPTDIKLRADHG